ncbi:MAG: transcription antitermination factor NusB [Gammaproteobacteria bacterium]
MSAKRASRSTERRRRSREQLVRAVYQWQLADSEAAELIEQFTANKRRPVDAEHFARVLNYVLQESDSLDAVIAEYAVRSLDHLDEIGRSILLVALSELSVCDDVPVKVTINEAVELAKRYGATDSYKFINAVLDKAARVPRGKES